MKKLRIAIVEDEPAADQLLSDFLARYGQENPGFAFELAHFSNGTMFIDRYKADFDLIFMDIQMPYMNGMEAAQKLRRNDADVLLVFVTSFAQFAINGYSVNAFDYLVKPLTYSAFSLRMARISEKLHLKDRDQYLLVNDKRGPIKIDVLDILYLEIYDHDVTLHTKEGDYQEYSTLRQVEKELPKNYFVRCNSCYIVNLLHVSALHSFTLVVAGKELTVSHPRRKELMERLKGFR